MATWKPYRVDQAVREINEGKFVLPVIQRKLVWDEDKMELLFDTLLKGDSFGSIIVIEEEQGSKPLFSFRHFTKDGSKLESSEVSQLDKTQYFVIDGQQRLQSFYIGLLGTMQGKNLYFDLFSNYESEYEFKFSKDETSLPKILVDEMRKTSDCCWYPVKLLYEELKRTNHDRNVAKQIIKKFSINDEEKKELIYENIAAFYRNITGETLGLSMVTIDKDKDEITNRQKIVELFKRLNNGGTVVNGFELVASILKSHDWRMEEYIDTTLEKFSDIGLNQNSLVKTIFLLRDNAKKEMAEITSEDASFAINNREKITSCFKAVRKFLEHSSLNAYYKEGGRSFIPLYFIIYHLFHKNIANTEIEGYFNDYDTKNTEFHLIKKWIYLSIINGVFSRGSGWDPNKTGINKIFDIMSQNKGNKFPYSEIIKMYKDHRLRFTDEITKDNLNELDRSFVFYLIYDKKPTTRKQDVDHVHSKKKLMLAGYDESKINNIFNYQLLYYKTNRGKNDMKLKDWIEKSVENKKDYLNEHLIPDDETLWIEENYEAFLIAREKLIMEKIKENGI
jgi:hypothetical protein